MNNFKIYQLVKKYKYSVGFFRDKPPINGWDILIRKSNDSYNITYQGEESKLSLFVKTTRGNEELKKETIGNIDDMQLEILNGWLSNLP